MSTDEHWQAPIGDCYDAPPAIKKDRDITNAIEHPGCAIATATPRSADLKKITITIQSGD